MGWLGWCGGLGGVLTTGCEVEAFPSTVLSVGRLSGWWGGGSDSAWVG